MSQNGETYSEAESRPSFGKQALTVVCELPESDDSMPFGALLTLANALEDAALPVMITNPSDDVSEGLRAFRDKRKPNFRGK